VETTSFAEEAFGRQMIRALTFGAVLAGLALLPLAGLAQEAEAPAEPEQNPFETDAQAEAPEVEKPNLPGEKPTVTWTDEEVAAAKAACTKMLAGVKLDYEPLPPIKEGICGAPAPILIKSIGADPAVVVDPPATVTCALAVTLDGWLKERVQPKAKATLGAAVVKVRNATSYSCRNRYDGANTRTSEHALANALDISEFVLASGERVTVLKSWPRVVDGPESSPLAPPVPVSNPARVAAASVAHETKAPAEVTGAVVAVSATRLARTTTLEVTKVKANPFVRPTPPPVAQPPRSALPQSSSISRSKGRATIELAKVKSNPFVSPVPAPGSEHSVPAAKPEAAAEPGPKSETAAEPPPSKPAPAAEAAFVRAVHAEACKVFGTVLGPGANEAHKDHFHLDMKARRRSSYCE
jgi:hypothetical protein